jgi:hypothetical protein
MTTKALILTMDNRPLLEEQVAILREEPGVDEIIVVDNGSRDDTAAWLGTQRGLTVVTCENRGPGPGRNAGLEAAGHFDWLLLLDGGIRPLRGSVAYLRAYLERRDDAQVVGLEIGDMTTDPTLGWTHFGGPVADADTYANRLLSHTAYCLARAVAFEGLRFCDEGPFGEPGWGVDDNEMACRWQEAGIGVHVVRGRRPYRRASGSFQRLHAETGIWPNQYGSVYEKRLVYCQQEWPQYGIGVQRGEPELTLVIPAGERGATARLVKAAHDRLRAPSREGRPYSIIVWGPADHELMAWAAARRLRQHHGDTIVEGGHIVRRDPGNEAEWTGDFRLWHGDDPAGGLRPGARAWALVAALEDLEHVLASGGGAASAQRLAL